MPVAATVVRDLRVFALLAARDMPAESRRAAALDRRHHLQLAEAHMAGVGSAPCRSMAAEDIRDLQSWARHARRALGWRFVLGRGFGLVLLGHQRSEAIERAHGLADGIAG